MRRLVSVYLAASRAFVDDYVALFRVGNYLDRLHRRLALAGAVTGIYIEVERPKAEGAMVSGGIAKRLYFLAAMGADKAVIIFRKSFAFHRSSRGAN